MHNVDMAVSIVPVLVALWAGLRAVQLYRHAVNRELLFQDNTGEMLQLRFLREVSLASTVLVAVYLLAKVRCTILMHYRGLPGDDVVLWTFVDSAIFGVIALLNLHGKQVADATVRAKEVERKNAILRAMIDAAGGFVWIKDSGGRYVFCDNTFCEFFFETPPTESVVGFTDVELLEAFRKRTGKRHTFGELCASTDDHCKEVGKKCRYIETGYIDGRLVVLDVVKTPLFSDSGECTGTVGMAWNRADECEHIQNDIQMYLKEGRLEELCHGVFWIKERIDECKWDNSFSWRTS